MATSTIRALILALAVVVGVLLIAKAFSGNASQGVAPKSSPGVSTSPSPSTSASTSPTPPAESLVSGVRIQVLNGTQSTGLGALQAKRLKHAGYKVVAVEQAPVAYKRTTIYYRAGFKANALAMKARYYPNAAVKPNPSSIQAKVILSVFLGADITASPSRSPSPSPSPSPSRTHTPTPTGTSSG